MVANTATADSATTNNEVSASVDGTKQTRSLVEEQKEVQVEGFAKTREGATYNNLYFVYFEFDGLKISRAREYNDTVHVYDTLRAGERRRA